MGEAGLRAGAGHGLVYPVTSPYGPVGRGELCFAGQDLLCSTSPGVPTSWSFASPYLAWSLVLQIPFKLSVRPFLEFTGLVSGNYAGDVTVTGAVEGGLAWQAWGSATPAALLAENGRGAKSHAPDRVERGVREHHAFVFRLLRRLGVPEEGADDALQQVFLIYAKRIAKVGHGKDKSFLFGIALRVARSTRRALSKLAPVTEAAILESIPAPATTGPEQALDDRRARALLDGLLDRMPVDLRTIFVLYEVEELTMNEISEWLLLGGHRQRAQRRAQPRCSRGRDERGVHQRGPTVGMGERHGARIPLQGRPALDPSATASPSGG